MGEIGLNVNVDVATTVVDMTVDVADSTADAPPKKISTSNLAAVAMECPRAESNKIKYIIFGAVGVILLIATIITGVLVKNKSNYLLQLNNTAESFSVLPESGAQISELEETPADEKNNDELTTLKRWDMAKTTSGEVTVLVLELSTQEISVEPTTKRTYDPTENVGAAKPTSIQSNNTITSVEVPITTGDKTGGTAPKELAEGTVISISNQLITRPIELIKEDVAPETPVELTKEDVSPEKPIELTKEDAAPENPVDPTVKVGTATATDGHECSISGCKNESNHTYTNTPILSTSVDVSSSVEISINTGGKNAPPECEKQLEELRKMLKIPPP